MTIQTWKRIENSVGTSLYSQFNRMYVKWCTSYYVQLNASPETTYTRPCNTTGSNATAHKLCVATLVIKADFGWIWLM